MNREAIIEETLKEIRDSKWVVLDGKLPLDSVLREAIEIALKKAEVE